MFSESAIRALLLSVGAGLSTLLGALIIFIAPKNSEKVLAISLGFAAGVMISVSFTDLFPNAMELLGDSFGSRIGVVTAVVSLAAGIILAALLDRFVPHQETPQPDGVAPHKNLFHVGFVSMIAIALHNFPEGIATFMAGYGDAKLGITIAVAIAMHNIPEGISVAMPIYFSTKSKRKAFKYVFLSGIAEPVGAILTFLVLQPFIGPRALGCIFALVAGIMLYIAIEELLPSSRQYGYDKQALLSVFMGICIMPLSHMF